MNNCVKCVEAAQKGANFCETCATPVVNKANMQQQNQHANTNESDQQAHPKQDDTKDILDTRTGMGVLSYLSILCLIPLIKGEYKNSEFVKLHLNQGIILFAAAIAWSLLNGIIVAILVSNFNFRALATMTTISTIMYGVIGIYSLIGTISSALGKSTKLPPINKIRILK